VCLIFCAWRHHPRYRLVVAANRDEYLARPTAPAAFWPGSPGLLAGRDLEGGGTWLGLTRSGRFAAITNYREPGRAGSGAPTRGRLVSDFLRGERAALAYLEEVAAAGGRYNGFSLMVCDGEELAWYSNRGGPPALLGPGLYGLSNHLLDTPWPKVERGKAWLAGLLAAERIAPEAVLAGLAEREPAPEAELPATGLAPELERALSARFVRAPGYGTRSSTVVLVEEGGAARFLERSYDEGGRALSERDFELRAAPVEYH